MKAVCIPCSGAVEVGGYLPILEHPLFQRLRRCRQLGLNDLVFPGAQHTRFEHALGVLARTHLLAMLQRMPDDDARHLEVFALLHDIGHGPFSHQIEPALRKNHHQRGLECLLELSAVIRECGAEPERIAAMLEEKDPLGKWVSDRNLGADKLDYLQRDAFTSALSGRRIWMPYSVRRSAPKMARWLCRKNSSRMASGCRSSIPICINMVI